MYKVTIMSVIFIVTGYKDAIFVIFPKFYFFYLYEHETAQQFHHFDNDYGPSQTVATMYSTSAYVP